MRKVLACSLVGLFVFGGALVACSGGGGGGASQASFCDELKKDKATFDQFNSGNADALTDETKFNAAVKIIDTLNSKAPSEIKSDMQTLDNAVHDLQKAESSSDFAKIASIGSQFSDQNGKIEQASKNVEKFAKDKCGVSLSSDTSSDSSSSHSSSRSSSTSLGSDFGLNSSDLSSLNSALSELSSLSTLFSS